MNRKIGDSDEIPIANPNATMPNAVDANGPSNGNGGQQQQDMQQQQQHQQMQAKQVQGTKEPPGTQKYACLYAPGIQNPMMQQQQGSLPNAQKSAPGNGGGPIGNVANQVFMQQQERMQTYVTFFPPAIQNPMMQQQQVAASGMQQQQGPWFKMHQMHVRNYPYHRVVQQILLQQIQSRVLM